MAGVFKVRFPEFEERSIAIVVLQSDNRVKDINSVIDYLTENFVYGAASVAKEGKGKPIIIRQGASVFEAIRGLGAIDYNNVLP